MENTAQKLEKLERKLKHTRFMLFGLVAVAIILGCLDAIPAHRDNIRDTIKAKKFVVVDANGETRAILGQYPHGSSLRLCDENGERRVILSQYSDGSNSLRLHDENGKVRAVLSQSPSGPNLALFDENENARAVFGKYSQGPMLALFDENGEIRADLSQNSKGSGLSLLDANGGTGVLLRTAQTTTPDRKTTTYPESSLLMCDPNGDVIWSAP